MGVDTVGSDVALGWEEAWVGNRDGYWVGDRDGEWVGDPDGDWVGKREGGWVGDRDGDWVGMREGGWFGEVEVGEDVTCVLRQRLLREAFSDLLCPSSSVLSQSWFESADSLK